MATKFRRKIKPKLHKFQFGIKYLVKKCVNSKVFGVGELKYTIGIYKGSKGVAMATKFMYKSVTIALISVLCQKN